MGCFACCCKVRVGGKERLLPEANLDLGPHSFTVLKLIGRGNFGKVCLVEKNSNKILYAMKILNKKFIKAKNQAQHTVTERRILETSSCPFIVKLHYAFQTKAKLYLVMEYVSGGELFFHLSQQKVFSEMRTRFYVAEILLGLDYLHSNGVRYRDLKPENVLLDSSGHIRLTDFGLSKSGIDEKNPKAFTFCGTPEYLAPEIIKNLAYDKAVDFWSLGALMYFMLSGAPPFYSSKVSEIYKNVTTKPIEPLKNISEACNDFMRGLLTIEAEGRLSDIEKIKKHAWFAGINWNDIADLRVDPPFRPTIEDMLDTRNFDKAFTSEKIVDSIDLANLSSNFYSGFTFRTNDSKQRSESFTES